MDLSNKKRKVESPVESSSTTTGKVLTTELLQPPCLLDPNVLGLVVESQFLNCYDLGRLLLCTTEKMPSIVEESPIMLQRQGNDVAESNFDWDTVVTLLGTTGFSTSKELFCKLLSGAPRLDITPLRYAPSDYTLIVDARLKDSGKLILFKIIPWDQIDRSSHGSYKFDEPVNTGVPLRDAAGSITIEDGTPFPLDKLHYTAKMLVIRKEADGKRNKVQLALLDANGSDIPRSGAYVYRCHDTFDYFNIDDRFMEECTDSVFNVASWNNACHPYGMSVDIQFEFLHGVVSDPSTNTTDGENY
eukprot:scaffold2874_cov92-Amphora_coffeaeformis.AAC.1